MPLRLQGAIWDEFSSVDDACVEAVWTRLTDALALGFFPPGPAEGSSEEEWVQVEMRVSLSLSVEQRCQSGRPRKVCYIGRPPPG